MENGFRRQRPHHDDLNAQWTFADDMKLHFLINACFQIERTRACLTFLVPLVVENGLLLRDVDEVYGFVVLFSDLFARKRVLYSLCALLAGIPERGTSICDDGAKSRVSDRINGKAQTEIRMIELRTSPVVAKLLMKCIKW